MEDRKTHVTLSLLLQPSAKVKHKQRRGVSVLGEGRYWVNREREKERERGQELQQLEMICQGSARSPTV